MAKHARKVGVDLVILRLVFANLVVKLDKKWYSVCSGIKQDKNGKTQKNGRSVMKK